MGTHKKQQAEMIDTAADGSAAREWLRDKVHPDLDVDAMDEHTLQLVVLEHREHEAGDTGALSRARRLVSERRFGPWRLSCQRILDQRVREIGKRLGILVTVTLDEEGNQRFGYDFGAKGQNFHRIDWPDHYPEDLKELQNEVDRFTRSLITHGNLGDQGVDEENRIHLPMFR
jgi:hypothetical protein